LLNSKINYSQSSSCNEFKFSGNMHNHQNRGREPMAREPDVALLMTASGSSWYFLNTIVTNETFSVIFHLPHYKVIHSTRRRINSKKHAIKKKIQTFTIV